VLVPKRFIEMHNTMSTRKHYQENNLYFKVKIDKP